MALVSGIGIMNGASCQRHGVAAGRPAQPSLRPGTLADSSRRCLKVAATDTLIKKPKLSYVGLPLATSKPRPMCDCTTAAEPQHVTGPSMEITPCIVPVLDQQTFYAL
jgi:hypothetical protein